MSLPMILSTLLFAVAAILLLLLAVRSGRRTARRRLADRVIWDAALGGRAPDAFAMTLQPARASIVRSLTIAALSIPMFFAGRSAPGLSAVGGPALADDEASRARALGPDDGAPWRIAQSTTTTKTCTHTDTHGDHTANHTDLHHDQVVDNHYDTHADGAPHADSHHDAC